MNKRLRGSQKAHEKSLALICLSASLVCCNGKDLNKLPLENLPNGEVFISKNYNRHWGYVQGSRNGYITYGKTPLGEVGGIGLAPDHKFRFVIKSLVQKWPECDSQEVQRAISKQEKELF